MFDDEAGIIAGSWRNVRIGIAAKLDDTAVRSSSGSRVCSTRLTSRGSCRHLAPETLHQLIRYRGLDACGELVASATPEQLTSVLDLDLWRNTQPGHDERFDEERFGEWLEMLVDSGGSCAARTVASIDESLVIAGLARYVRVFDPAPSSRPRRAMTSQSMPVSPPPKSRV